MRHSQAFISLSSCMRLLLTYATMSEPSVAIWVRFPRTLHHHSKVTIHLDHKCFLKLAPSGPRMSSPHTRGEAYSCPKQEKIVQRHALGHTFSGSSPHLRHHQPPPRSTILPTVISARDRPCAQSINTFNVLGFHDGLVPDSPGHRERSIFNTPGNLTSLSRVL
jgi:hypothetical protein